MSLSNGRQYLAIPGPSVTPDRVLQAMHRPSMNIYAGDLVDMTHSLIPDLKAIARTQHNVALYIANGHGAWEAALANTLSRGDKVLVLATGRFAHGWSDMARMMGVQCDILDFGKQSTFDLYLVSNALSEDRSHDYKAVLAVQVDTSTSVKNDIHALRKCMDAADHPALLMVDCIACLGCDRFDMDGWGVDVMVAGCQKGLMTPPGLSFVYFNDKADAAREQANCVTHYWDWRPRVSPDLYYQYFDGTAPTHLLYGLREALNMINEEGLETVWFRHETLARSVWSALDHWGQVGDITMNISDPDIRSVAVTTIQTKAPDADRLRQWCEQNAGVTLGIGLGMVDPGEPGEGSFFRIGHMGHLNPHMVLGGLAAIEAGLSALSIPHEPGGVSAAARTLALS